MITTIEHDLHVTVLDENGTDQPIFSVDVNSGSIEINLDIPVENILEVVDLQGNYYTFTVEGNTLTVNKPVIGQTKGIQELIDEMSNKERVQLLSQLMARVLIDK